MEKMASQTVLVIYEDETTQSAAVAFCDDLVSRFWTRCDISVEWCSFSALTDARSGRAALHKAAEADLIVFAAQPDDPLPAHIDLWLTSWVTQRGQRDGAVIGLLDPSSGNEPRANRYTLLRSIAHKAGMDYLTQAPQQFGGVLGCVEECSRRAQARTDVLEGILKRPHLPVAT